MHQCIRLIVYAEDESQAMKVAQGLLDDRLTSNGTFDYGSVLEEKNSWGHKNVALADSKEGKKIIKEGMDYTKRNFMEAMRQVRQLVANYTDEEIFEEKEDPKKADLRKKIVDKLNGVREAHPFWKHAFYQVGKYDGADIFLYDNDGSGIRDSEHLQNALDKWKCLDKEAPRIPAKDKVWVVCADVHY